MIDKLDKYIKKAAKIVARDWPGVIEEQDVVQQLYVKLLESPGTIEKVLTFEDRGKARFLTRIGHQIASQERADYDYYKGAYLYSVQEVKSVLAAGILVEEFDHWVDVVHDLIEALEVLVKRSPQYVDAILDRYAEWNQPTTSNGKVILSRALTALTDAMNLSNKRRFSERDDGPGTGGALTREQARWASKDGWDADFTPAPAHLRDNSIEPEVWV